PLATGVDSHGQLRQEAGVELTPGKGWRQVSRVHARQPRLEARPDHVAGQRVRGNAPEGEERRDARGREVVLPVAADVLQEQVTERHGGDALAPGPVERRAHRGLVVGIAAWARDTDRPEREPDSGSLCLEE